MLKKPESIKIFEKAFDLNQNPNKADTCFNKALSLDGLGRYEDALIFYDKSIEIDSNLAQAYANKGLVLYNLERNDEAVECFKIAIDLEPNEPSTYNNW